MGARGKRGRGRRCWIRMKGVGSTEESEARGVIHSLTPLVLHPPCLPTLTVAPSASIHRQSTRHRRQRPFRTSRYRCQRYVNGRDHVVAVVVGVHSVSGPTLRLADRRSASAWFIAVADRRSVARFNREWLSVHYLL